MPTGGAIAASDPQTVQAGMAMFEAGGNAVDAAVAGALASFVVEPPLTSPAGGGAMLLGSQQRGWQVVDLMANAPGLDAEAGHALDFHAVEVDYGPTTQRFHIGRASAAVPGLVPGLLAIHRMHGRLPLADIVAPAVRFAREGFVLSAPIQWVHSLLEPIVTYSEGVRQITCKDGALAPAGSVLHNRPLGDFLEELGRAPQDALTRFKRATLEAFGPHSGGLITASDLDAWSHQARAPLRVPFAGHHVLLNPPPASGGGLVAAALRAFELVRPANDAWLGPAHLRAVATSLSVMSELRLAGYDEAVRSGFDAETWLGEQAIASHLRRAAARREERQLGQTTHISVADDDGLAVGLTTSNGEGSGHVLPGLGIHMNNFLGEEDINPDGFHQHPPGSRMPTMMAPTVVLKDDAPAMVLGSGGSNRIRSAVFQGLVNHLWFGCDLDLSVNTARLHVEGDQLWFEAAGLGTSSVEALEQDWSGATRFDAVNMFFGGVHSVTHAGGAWRGAGDRRRGGTASTSVR